MIERLKKATEAPRAVAIVLGGAALDSIKRLVQMGDDALNWEPDEYQRMEISMVEAPVATEEELNGQ